MYNQVVTQQYISEHIPDTSWDQEDEDEVVHLVASDALETKATIKQSEVV